MSLSAKIFAELGLSLQHDEDYDDRWSCIFPRKQAHQAEVALNIIFPKNHLLKHDRPRTSSFAATSRSTAEENKHLGDLSRSRTTSFLLGLLKKKAKPPAGVVSGAAGGPTEAAAGPTEAANNGTGDAADSTGGAEAAEADGAEAEAAEPESASPEEEAEIAEDENETFLDEQEQKDLLDKTNGPSSKLAIARDLEEQLQNQVIFTTQAHQYARKLQDSLDKILRTAEQVRSDAQRSLEQSAAALANPAIESRGMGGGAGIAVED